MPGGKVPTKHVYAHVMQVMQMRNVATGAGIEPIFLAFWASMLTIIPSRFPDVTTLHIYTCLCGSLPDRSVYAGDIVVLLCYCDAFYVVYSYIYTHINHWDG